MKLPFIFSSKAMAQELQKTMMLEQQVKALSDQLSTINSSLQSSALVIGNSISLYGESDFISKGYNKNAAVYSIVSKCARKLAQVPVNHYRIKRNERKTWEEYLVLTKDLLTPESVMEAKKMRKKALEDGVVDSELSKLLQRPNNHQAGALFREQLYGYKLLTGEGNIWINRGGTEGGRPVGLEIIPKKHVQIKPGAGLWDIDSYVFVINGRLIPVPKEDVLMWAYANYNFNPQTLEHLRGMSPLTAGLLTMQADNEGEERAATMNKNQGAAGLLFREDKPSVDPTSTQVLEIRRQVNNTVNNKEMAGAFAVMAGKWGYHQLGLDAQQLQLLERSDVNMTKLCNIFDTPPGLFAKDQTYENAKENKRNWVFDNIAPACYSLRDELNAKLLPAFNLDRESHTVDFDVLALPEMAIDMQKMITALKDADFLTLDEKRIAVGYEALNTPESKAIYIGNGKQTLTQAFEGVGGGLDNEEALLNNQ